MKVTVNSDRPRCAAVGEILNVSDKLCLWVSESMHNIFGQYVRNISDKNMFGSVYTSELVYVCGIIDRNAC